MNFKVVVVTHGSLGAEMLASAQMIGGELAGVETYGLFPGEQSKVLAERLTPALSGPTLILTDLRGGTPDNVARVLAKRHPEVSVVSNANLPILLEAVLGDVELTEESLTELCELGNASFALGQPAHHEEE